jgi:hypothetical protein
MDLLSKALEANSKEYYDKSFDTIRAIEYAEKCNRQALKELRQMRIEQLKEMFMYWKFMKLKT